MKQPSSNVQHDQLSINTASKIMWALSYKIFLLSIFLYAALKSTPGFGKSIVLNRELQSNSNSSNIIEKLKAAREANNNIGKYLSKNNNSSKEDSNIDKDKDHIPSEEGHTRETEYVVLEDEESRKVVETCSPIGECTLCQDMSRPSCKETGREIQLRCITMRGKEEDLSIRRNAYRSCKSTTEDEEYLLLQAEFFFLILGALSTLSARFQKKRNVSLFDQRWSKKVRQTSLAFTFQPGILGVDEDLSSKLNKNDNYGEPNTKEIQPLISSTKQNGKSTLHNRTGSSSRLNDFDSIRDGETLISSSSGHGRIELEMV